MKTKRIMRFAVIVGVIVLPLAYSLFYLGAFWDPYSRMDDVPVAVVNEDKGAVIDGKDKNLGEDLVDNLLDEGSLKFVVTDADDAENGIEKEGEGYYASITIPKDFSKNIASADDSKKVQGELIYAVNEKKNFLASQILNSAMVTIEKELNANVDKEITLQLTNKLREVPEKLDEISSGFGELQDGSSKLKDGAVKLDDGIGFLQGNTGKLIGAVNQLDNGVGELGQKSILLKDGASQLNAGVGELGQKSVMLKDGAAQLDTGIMQLQGKSVLLKDGASQLDAGISQLQGSTSALVNGVSDLDSGAARLKGGVDQLSSKKSDFVAMQQGVAQLNGAVAGDGSAAPSSNAGLNKNLSYYVSTSNSIINSYFDAQIQQMIAAGASETDSAVVALKQQKASLTGLGSQLSTSVSGTLAPSVGQLNQKVTAGINGYTDPTTGQKVPGLLSAIDALNEGSSQLKAGTSQLKTKTDTMPAGIDQLKAGSSQLADGTSQLVPGVDQLRAGSKQLAAGTNLLVPGVTKLQGGAYQLADGTIQLVDGTKLLKDGSGQLNAAAAQLAPGINQLKDGSSQLAAGSKELNDGVVDGKKELDENIDKTKSDLTKLDGLDDYAKDPVNLKTDRINDVPNYGTAFAPYFMSLSLWVGGLLLFFGIYLDIDKRFPLLSRESEKKGLRAFAFLALGVGQAIVLAIVVKWGLGLTVVNLPGFIAATILVSCVFISIIQFCLVHLKDAGKFVSIILLILQLTSCGGTFPMETVPKFFNILYPFMPMTYSVMLFKETISGQTDGSMAFAVSVLVGIMIAFMAITVVLSLMKKGAKSIKKGAEAAAH